MNSGARIVDDDWCCVRRRGNRAFFDVDFVTAAREADFFRVARGPRDGDSARSSRAAAGITAPPTIADTLLFAVVNGAFRGATGTD